MQRRFFAMKRHFTDKERAFFMDVDFSNHVALVVQEANWLPAPKGEFIPMLRMYWPKNESPSILNGSWKPPAVQKAS